MTPPKTLIEMVEYNQFQKKLVLESAEKHKQIDLISDYIFVLSEMAALRCRTTCSTAAQ
jgi:hypothetical protein